MLKKAVGIRFQTLSLHLLVGTEETPAGIVGISAEVRTGHLQNTQLRIITDLANFTFSVQDRDRDVTL
jgi:hypothetical protein